MGSEHASYVYEPRFALPGETGFLHLFHLAHGYGEWYFGILREEAEQLLELLFRAHLDIALGTIILQDNPSIRMIKAKGIIRLE